MKILILTDHRTHSATNSIYFLANALRQHPVTSHVHLASRGDIQNEPFFTDLSYIKTGQTNIYISDSVFTFTSRTQVNQHFENTQLANVLNYDVLILRIPHPIEEAWLRQIATLDQRLLLINHPIGILETGSKAFLTHFPDLCPPMRICSTPEEIYDMASEYTIVIKPLKGYGGRGIVKVEAGLVDFNNGSPLTWTQYLPQLSEELEHGPLQCVKYLKNVTQGDKRIVVINGEILGASLRQPKDGSWLCNVAQGGASSLSPVTDEEYHIVKTIDPTMKKLGIAIYGIDTLVDDNERRCLSEINTLSIGGFQNMFYSGHEQLPALTADHLMNYIQKRLSHV